MRLLEKIDNVYRLLASKKFALYLFLGLALVLVPKTLLSKPNLYLDRTMQAVLGLLLVNLCLCTVHRFAALRRATLLIHFGAIVTIVGGLISAFGYVATINIHEGAAVDTVFRWDVKQDIPLGFDLAVKKIQREFYPVPVQVGVMNQGQKAELQTLKTGESFQWGQFRVFVDVLDPERKTLMLQVYDKSGQHLGSYDTSGENSLPAGFPLGFKLVAYKDPVLKNVGADLVLSDKGNILAKGRSMVNDPFKWQGLKFHVTSVAVDQFGQPYVGIQIVKDPGVYLAYAGFVIICLGCLLHLQSIFRDKTGR